MCYNDNMNTNTHTTKHLLHLELGVDGDLVVLDADDARVCEVPAAYFIANDLFNEERPGFDWDEDADLAFEVLNETLRWKGYSHDGSSLQRAVRLTCVPGGIHDPADYVFDAYREVA